MYKKNDHHDYNKSLLLGDDMDEIATNNSSIFLAASIMVHGFLQLEFTTTAIITYNVVMKKSNHWMLGVVAPYLVVRKPSINQPSVFNIPLICCYHFIHSAKYQTFL